MAADNTRDVELRLIAKTSGEKEIKSLADEIKALAKQGGDAAPEFTRLAAEVEKLGDQIGAVDTLGKLRAEVEQLGAAQRDAAGKADGLKVELETLTAAARQADAAEQASLTTLKATQRALAEQRDELGRLKASYDDAGKRTKEYRDEATRLNLAILDSKAAIREQKDALEQAKAAASSAGDAEDKLAKQYDRSAKAARDSLAALEARKQALREADASLAATGVATDDLVRSQETLVNSLQQVSRAALGLQALSELAADEERAAAAAAKAAAEQEKLARALREADNIVRASTIAEELDRQEAAARAATKAYQDGVEGLKLLEQEQRQAAASADAAAKSEAEFAARLREADNIVRASAIAAELEKQERASTQAAASQRQYVEALKTVGDRSRDIKGEIEKINAALDFLARNTRVSGEEFDRSFASGQARIAKLRAELEGVKAPATGGAGGLNLFRGALGQLTAAFGAYEAGSFVVKAVNDLEQMRRVLTLITGSSETAAKQIEFLKSTANTAGVAFGTIAGEFARFEASLLSAGISLKTTNDVFASVTKAAGVLGQSSADTEAALRALGQMASKGKVSMEELGQQLGERMPAVLSVTAKSLGITSGELIKLMESGKLLADEEFFAAFGRAVDKTFVQGAGKISGMRAEFNRFIGTVTEGVQILSDGAIGKAVGAALGGIGETLKYLVFTASLVGESFDVMGKQIGTVVAALVTGDLKNLPVALNEIQEKSDAKMTALVARMQGISTATTEAGTAAKGTGEAMTQAAAGAQTNAAAQQGAANAATANAAAQGAAATSVTAAGTAAGGAASSWAKLALDYQTAEGAATAKVRTSEQLVKAARVEGEALVQIAALSGDVTQQRQIELRAAEGVYAAEVALQRAKQGSIDVQVAEIAAMQEYIRVHGDANGARAKEIVDRETKLKQSQAEIDRNNVEVVSLQNLVAQRQSQSAALADNSQRVDELRAAYDRSKVAQDAATQALSQAQMKFTEGKMTQEGLNAAVLAYEGAARTAAVAASGYRDALTDAARAAALNAQAVKVAADTMQARLSVEQQSLEVSARVAQASGDEAAAAEFSTRAKWKQIDAVRAAQQAKVTETNATIAALEAQRNEITGTDDISNGKRQEIELRIQAERVKLIEARASDDVVRGLRAEIDALNTRAVAAGQAQQADERYRLSQQQTREQKLAGQAATDNTGLQSLEAKRQAGTLTADDLATAKAVLDASKSNAQTVYENRGTFSLQGQSSVDAALASATAIYEQVQSIANRKAPSTGTATPQVTGGTKTLNINIGGKTTTLSGLSSQNADALTSLLRQLESASTTTGG